MKYRQKEDSAYEYFGRSPEEMDRLKAQSAELAAWIESLPPTLEGLKKAVVGYGDEWGNPVYWFPKAGRRLPGVEEVAAKIRAALGDGEGE